MAIFVYDEEMLKQLKQKDETLAKIIDEIGLIEREIRPIPLHALIDGIIAQQISKKAAASVSDKLKVLSNNYDLTTLANLSDEDIQSCGLSFRKVEYIKGLVKAVQNRELDLDNLANLSNEEVISELVKIRGLGQWSAEMFLIFCLNRYDVIAYDDLIIKKALIKLYNLDSLSKKEFKLYQDLYGEYASIASLYLWEYYGRIG